jgi:aspartate racemase
VKTGNGDKQFLGVLGGMGPLASAEFLKTIYEQGLGEREQESPPVILYSDPTFPDRTEALLAGECGELLAQLAEALRRLSALGVSKIVICCITIHHLLPLLPAHLRGRVISLLDVIFEEVARSRKRHLLICTTGTRRLGLFQRHERWAQLQDFFVLAGDDDQEAIHELIYRVKKNHDPRALVPRLEALLLKYEVDSFIAGCTETHLLAKRVARGPGVYGCIDPLSVIARGMRESELVGEKL